MDGSCFDSLTRLVASSTSRRGILRTLGAAALGGAGALLGGGEAGACAPADFRCPRGIGCCSGRCCNGVCCDYGEVCRGGVCCSLENTCNGRCVDTWTDPANCGACGHVCAPGLACQDGHCACHPTGAICAGDTECCSGICDFGTCQACRALGGACATDGDCCGDSGYGVRCFDGTCRCCGASGSAGCGLFSTDDACCPVGQSTTLCCTDPDYCRDPNNSCVAVCCDSECTCPCPAGTSWAGCAGRDELPTPCNLACLPEGNGCYVDEACCSGTCYRNVCS